MAARAAAALITTAGAVALLASFRTPPAPGPRSSLVPSSPSGSPTPTSPPGAGDQAAPSVATATPTPTPTATPGGSGLRNGRYTGEDVSMRYGDVQVQVVVSGGRITDVVALQMPSDRARSAYISQVAGPMLHDEVLQAQSAQIDTLSGATYTSDAYAQSVQAALDKAGA
jgi:uncharacterized protein with FMN-binding domain